MQAVSDVASTLGFKDATAQMTEEYKYDASGNLIFDHNKSLSNIEYNHLNLPSKVELTRQSGQSFAIDRIIFTYSALGVKLKKEVFKDGTSGSNGTLLSVTDYDGDFQYDQAGAGSKQLNMISHPEGRVIKKGNAFEYEYFYKDPIGNVRLTYGLLSEFDEYRATMENPPAPSQLGTKENNTFKNINTTRLADPVFNFTQPSVDVTAPNSSSRTNSFSNLPLGPAISLHLSAGDVVNMEVMAKYDQPSNGTATLDPAIFLTALATTTFGYSVGEIAYNSFNSNALVIPGIGGASNVLPKAYLAYIFFDDNYQFVSLSSGAASISTAAYNSFEKLTRSFTAPKSGYIYIYTANESNTVTSNVYFDEMYVTRKGLNGNLQVTQANDYYPFGLAYNSYQKSSSVENKYKFQGQERLDDLGIGWDQFKWRNHQPDLGRFFGVDPLSSKYVYNSPYAFSENHVTSHVELEGLEKWCINFIDGSAGETQGPWKDKGTAQQMIDSRPLVNGMINSSVIQSHVVKSLEQTKFKRSPEGIVLHRTAGSSLQPVFDAFVNRGFGTHFVVDKDGTVYQTASLEKWTQHVGEPKTPGQKFRSINTIGIEVVGNYNKETKQWEPLTADQMMATADLVNTLMKIFKIDPTKIGNHEDLSKKEAREGATVNEAIDPCLIGCKERSTPSPSSTPNTPSGSSSNTTTNTKKE